MEKRQTRIPRPAARPPAVEPLKVFEQASFTPNCPAARARKPKCCSLQTLQGFAGPYRSDTDNSLVLKDVNGRKRKEAPSAAQLQAPAAKRAAVAREPSQEDATWEDFAAQGDTALHCLGHKLSLKKRDTAAVVRDLTLAYIKRLRALGWHLHAQCERCCDRLLSLPVTQSTHRIQ